MPNKITLDETLNSIDKEAKSLRSIEHLLENSVLKYFAKINSELQKMSVQLGKGRGGVEEMNDAVKKLNMELGESRDEATATIKALGDVGYLGNFKKAGEAISQFSRSTDASKTSLANVSAVLTKVGKLSDDMTASTYASILKIQQGYGLTKKGMDDVMNAIPQITNNMKGLGATDVGIRNMAVSFTKLVSSLEKVGYSVQEATQLLDKMLNPERITENIGLYTQLGVSISDALSGNINGEQLQYGLKEFGQKLKDMGPIAGAAYAKAFGVSYIETIKAAGLSEITEDVLTPEQEAFNSLNEMKKITQDGYALLNELIEKFKGLQVMLGPMLFFVHKSIWNSVSKIKLFIIDTIKKIKEEIKGIDISQKHSIEKEIEALMKKSELMTKEQKRLKEASELIEKENNGMSTWKSRRLMNKSESLKTKNEKIGKKFDRLVDQQQHGATRSVGATAKGIAKGAGKAAFGIAKFAGYLGIITSILGSVLQKSEKFQQLAQKISDLINSKIVPFAEKMADALQPLVDELMEPISELLDSLFELFSAVAPIVINILVPVMKAMLTVVKLLTEGVRFIIDKFVKKGNNLETIAENTKQTAQNTDKAKRERIYTSANGNVRIAPGSLGTTMPVAQVNQQINDSRYPTWQQAKDSAVVKFLEEKGLTVKSYFEGVDSVKGAINKISDKVGISNNFSSSFAGNKI